MANGSPPNFALILSEFKPVNELLPSPPLKVLENRTFPDDFRGNRSSSIHLLEVKFGNES